MIPSPQTLGSRNLRDAKAAGICKSLHDVAGQGKKVRKKRDEGRRNELGRHHLENVEGLVSQATTGAT